MNSSQHYWYALGFKGQNSSILQTINSSYPTFNKIVTNPFAGHKITEQKQEQCKYLVKKLVELSQFEQISVPFRESHGPAIEKDENSMFQLIDHIFAKVSVSCSIAGKSRCLLSQRLSSHAQQVFVSVVEHSTDLKNRDEFAVRVKPKIK